MPAQKVWIAGIVAVAFWPANLPAQVPTGAGAFTPSAGASALIGPGRRRCRRRGLCRPGRATHLDLEFPRADVVQPPSVPGEDLR